MGRQGLLSFGRESYREKSNPYQKETRRCVPWIETPLDLSFRTPRLARHSDATPIELFFDLFLVANLSTFTATHEINNLEALWSYIGFLAIIWFTWFQVTLHDIRFARDSVFERTFKAIQLATMVGFASAGSGFATRVRDENVWAFHSLSILLAVSRLMLCVQYIIAASFLYLPMPSQARRLLFIAFVLLATSATYTGLYFLFNNNTDRRGPYVWTAWCLLFAIETHLVMTVSRRSPGIGFEDTHLNVRMQLLTLIIIGEGVISITRVVNRTVGGGGWTKWSFVHILGITAAVYLLWQSYFAICPKGRFGAVRQQLWAQLHFPFHVILILLSEGSEILVLMLDISLKVRDLKDTIVFSCELPRPDPTMAIDLLNSTITDMEIHYQRGALEQQSAIQSILQYLRDNPPLCPTDGSPGSLTLERAHHLMGNVTAGLFASMGITPPADDLATVKEPLLMMYLRILGLVYVYYFVVAALTMFMFATFLLISEKYPVSKFKMIGIGTRIFMGVFLMCLTAFMANFDLTYRFMTNPMIIFTFTMALFATLLIDRLLDWLSSSSRESTHSTETPRSILRNTRHLTQLSPVPTPSSSGVNVPCSLTATASTGIASDGTTVGIANFLG